MSNRVIVIDIAPAYPPNNAALLRVMVIDLASRMVRFRAICHIVRGVAVREIAVSLKLL